MRKLISLILFTMICLPGFGQVSPKTYAKLDQKAIEINDKVIQWRRDFHQYPELSNREFNTGKKIAEHLKNLGLEVKYPWQKPEWLVF